MIDQALLETDSLLLLCAILRQFDAGLLHELAAPSAGAFEALMTDALCVPLPNAPGSYQVRPDVRAHVLAHLRAARPLDEIALHDRAFRYYHARLTQPSAARRDDEAACMYHLDGLFSLLNQRMEWQQIADYTAAMHAVGVHQHQHRQRLDLYDGIVAVRTTRYDHGETLLKNLLAEKNVEDDVRLRAISGLGHMCLLQSRFEQALLWYQQQLAFASEIGDRVYQALALINIGVIYNDLDQAAMAYEYSARSRELFHALGEHVREAFALYAMGRDAMHLGRWLLAQQHYEAATVIAEAHALAALLIPLYWGQGYLSLVLGNLAAAEAWFRRAIDLAQQPGCDQTTVAMDAYIGLGLLHRVQARWDAALASYDQAANLALRLEKTHRWCRIQYHRGLLFEQRGDYERALDVYIQAIDGNEALRSATESEDIKLGLLGTTQQLYESAVLLCLALDRPRDALHLVERARSRAFLDLLAKKAAAHTAGIAPTIYDELAQPVVTVAEIQARLPADALLVEYFTTGVLPRGEHLINKLPPENTGLRAQLTLPPHVLIFAITRDTLEVHRAALDPNTLRPQIGDAGPSRRLLRERMRVSLYERLVAPVRHLMTGRRVLYLVPHGPLHYVPFTALCAASGEYLVAQDGPALAFAPSATILLRNCLDRPPREQGTFLALGYNDTEAAALRYAESEARLLAQIMGGQAWAGPEPKSARLLAESTQARWLHIAGHAVYDSDDPLASELRLGPNDALSARAIISELRLQADLVTLSACTSGLSYVVPGDELLGLQRALLYAGAPSIVGTLWEAADLVALLVMERVYQGLRQGDTAAEALRDAQVYVRSMTGRDLMATLERWRASNPEAVAAMGDLPIVPAEQHGILLYSDPVYWAPFMLIGRP